jgi:hypothetical protein
VKLKHKIAGLAKVMLDFERRFGVPVPAKCMTFMVFISKDYVLGDELRKILSEARAAVHTTSASTAEREHEIKVLVAEFDEVLAILG